MIKYGDEVSEGQSMKQLAAGLGIVLALAIAAGGASTYQKQVNPDHNCMYVFPKTANYRIRKGDTLSEIAERVKEERKLKGSIGNITTEIAFHNNLPLDAITAGEEIKLPEGERK